LAAEARQGLCHPQWDSRSPPDVLGHIHLPHISPKALGELGADNCCKWFTTAADKCCSWT